jgi:hypothetical protein
MNAGELNAQRIACDGHGFPTAMTRAAHLAGWEDCRRWMTQQDRMGAKVMRCCADSLPPVESMDPGDIWCCADCGTSWTRCSSPDGPHWEPRG